MSTFIKAERLRPTDFSIVLGLFLLILDSILGEIPQYLQLILFVVSLFLTGIPHGALDHLIAQETQQRAQQNTFNLVRFMVRYLAVMLFYGVFWYFFPTLSLYFFLIISAWHWGETDIQNVAKTWFWYATRFFWGCFILFFILLTHSSEVAPIWYRILRYDTTGIDFWNFVTQYRGTFLLGSGLSFMFSLGLAYFHQKVFFDKKHYLRLFIVLIITYFLPLLPAFALYFSGWHSVNAFYDIKKYLTERQQHIVYTDILQIWQRSLPFTLLAFNFLVVLVAIWNNYFQDWDPIPLVYIFLSLITLPHLGVMHSVNQPTMEMT